MFRLQIPRIFIRDTVGHAVIPNSRQIKRRPTQLCTGRLELEFCLPERSSGARVDGAAGAAAFAGGAIDALFRVDHVMTTTFGGGNSARRALFSAGCARSAFFGFDDVGHDRNRWVKFWVGLLSHEDSSMASRFAIRLTAIDTRSKFSGQTADQRTGTAHTFARRP